MTQHTASWQKQQQRGAGELSLTARALLAIGNRLQPHESGIAGREPPIDVKYANFFRLFPQARTCAGLRIAELGCGTGDFTAWMAERGPELVCAVEPNAEWSTIAKSRTRAHRCVEIHHATAEEALLGPGEFDRVIVHDVIEHCPDPVAALAAAGRWVRHDGEILLSFMPWFAPYGAHTWSCLPLPWGHLFYSQRVLAEMRSSKSGWHTTDLGATGMYKVTVADLRRHVKAAGLRFKSLRLEAVKRQRWMLKVPGLRELGTAIVGAVLVRM